MIRLLIATGMILLMAVGCTLNEPGAEYLVPTGIPTVTPTLEPAPRFDLARISEPEYKYPPWLWGEETWKRPGREPEGVTPIDSIYTVSCLGNRNWKMEDKGRGEKVWAIGKVEYWRIPGDVYVKAGDCYIDGPVSWESKRGTIQPFRW